MLVHGWACDANYWNEQFDALKAHYTVVAVNLAGHGALRAAIAPTGRSPTTPRDVAAVVARRCPTRSWCWSGTPWAPTVALAAAPLIGTRVIGIIAVDALRSVGRPPLAPPRDRAARGAVSRRLHRRDAQARDRLAVREGRRPTLVQKVAYDMSLEPPGIAVAEPAARCWRSTSPRCCRRSTCRCTPSTPISCRPT